MSLLVRLHGVKTGTVRNYGEALQLLGQLRDGEVLWLRAQGVQVAEVPVHGVVLHDGDPGQGSGPQDELGTCCSLRVIGAVHTRVCGGRLALVGGASLGGNHSVHPWLLAPGHVRHVGGGGRG